MLGRYARGPGGYRCPCCQDPDTTRRRKRAEQRETGREIRDEFEITLEEFEAAKAHLIERHGAIPSSLQRVIDLGGRFGRAEPPSA